MDASEVKDERSTIGMLLVLSWCILSDSVHMFYKYILFSIVLSLSTYQCYIDSMSD